MTKLSKYNTNYYQYWFLLLLLLFSTALYIFLCLLLNIWRDEVYTLKTIENGIIPAIKSAMLFEEQPPLYFALASLWKILVGNNVFGIRAFSVIFSSAFLLILFRFVKKISNSFYGTLALTFAVAVHPQVIWMATEARGYALWAFLILLQIYIFFKSFVLDSPQQKDWIGILSTSLLSVLTHPFTVFILFSELIVLVFFRKWKYLAYLMGVCLVILIIVSPVYYEILSASSEAITPSLESKNVIELADQFSSRAVKMVIPGNEPLFMSYRGLTAFAIILCWFLIGGPIFLRSNIGIFLITLFIGFELLWFLSIQITGLEWLGKERYGIVVLPVFYLILSGGENTTKDTLKNIKNLNILIIIAAFAIVPLVWNSVIDFYSLEKGGDWARVSNYIEDNETEDQPIVVFRNEVAYSLKYHYTGINEIIPFPRELSFKSFDPKDFAVSSLDEVSNTFSKHIEEDSRVWIVTDEVYSYRGVDFGHEYFEAFLENSTKEIYDKGFYGSRVRLVRYTPSKKE